MRARPTVPLRKSLKRRRSLLTIALVVVSSLLSLAPSRAALVFEVSLTPSAPGVGERVVVAIRVYAADASGSRGDPYDADEFPWRVEAVSSKGDSIAIPVTRGDEPGLWSGTVVFSEPGRWEVGLTREHVGNPVDSRFGGSTTVDVVKRHAPGEGSGNLPWILGVVMVAAGAAAWALRRMGPRCVGSSV